ncbi:hypothetical protein CVT25_002762 [Psilocybe cyanescens]|uniref:Uncharacterized protein n=1 Tax=Psilocybe cyanescens TaxID=93625 RepID=A0A409X5Q0_PSICY|nr:hypothetical protein CVT25_002762 [Psilocybe cyanescens]
MHQYIKHDYPHRRHTCGQASPRVDGIVGCVAHELVAVVVSLDDRVAAEQARVAGIDGNEGDDGKNDHIYRVHRSNQDT